MCLNMPETLYISPSTVCLQLRPDRSERTHYQLTTTRMNFSDNSFKGKVSEATMKKIRKTVNWMVTLAKPKVVRAPKSKAEFMYKCGLLTVSLPTGLEDCTPKFFRDVLLTSLMDAMRYQFNLHNYIWKLEKQKRGALHAHITIDKFIPYEWLNQKWCEILKKNGLMKSYTETFEWMTRREYVQHRTATDKANVLNRYKSKMEYVKALVKAYEKGVNTNWSLPNCSDVHSVKSVKNLASYMAKYLSKEPEFDQSFKGRFWSCSHNLSKLRSVKLNITDDNCQDVYKAMDEVCTKQEDIFRSVDFGQDVKWLGTFGFLTHSRKVLYSNWLFGNIFRTLDTLYHASKIYAPPEFNINTNRIISVYAGSPN